MQIDYAGTSPVIDETALLLPTATIIGDVVIGKDSSVWFQVVIRGDVNHIRIGDRTNIQDGSVIHVTNKTHPTVIGNDVTIGHNVTLHGCTIGNRCLIGIGAIVLDGAEIGSDSLVAAGSVVAPGTVIPPGSLALGSPARIKRQLSDKEIAHLQQSADNYLEYKKSYSGRL
ncbi:MAG: gamma carbonic anhydrase family protein [Desulfuromonas sp.]|nr:MAG: gamma carbonic anhydrase family protein [Desulfuromonas sp.]